MDDNLQVLVAYAAVAASSLNGDYDDDENYWNEEDLIETYGIWADESVAFDLFCLQQVFNEEAEREFHNYMEGKSFFTDEELESMF